MKQRIFKCSWIRPELAGIHLVDKCLILFMTILLIQSACTLLGFPGNTAQANEIDVIIRTSSAAIFGYFLSANFILEPVHPAQDSRKRHGWETED